eukprot:5927723-Pleurochrysis_carterae.AAC.2
MPRSAKVPCVRRIITYSIFFLVRRRWISTCLPPVISRRVQKTPCAVAARSHLAGAAAAQRACCTRSHSADLSNTACASGRSQAPLASNPGTYPHLRSCVALRARSGCPLPIHCMT